MYVLIVEDDPVQFDLLSKNLKNLIPAIRVSRIATELEFYQNIDRIGEDKPDLIVLDIMLRWCDPDRNMTLPPSTVEDEGIFRAGFRCLEKLRANPKTSDIQTIFVYTVLDDEDIAKDMEKLQDVDYTLKDFDVRKIIRKIQHLKR